MTARANLSIIMARVGALLAISGCLFALDSDAHTTNQLAYAETAIAHARLAGIPADRIVNCWTVDRLLAWIAEPMREAASMDGARPTLNGVPRR